MDHKYLSIYLKDHLAGAMAGRELAHRAAGNNRGSEYGAFLDALAREVDEDRETLLSLMGDLGVGTDRAKVAGAWVVEKLRRLKPNGRLRGYSPLSRVVELETLLLGVRGKQALWQALDNVSSGEPRLAAAGLPALIARADRQIEGLDEHRLRAAREAFAG
jgi:hypothetical protein